MKYSRKIQEWAADRFSFVQYPRTQRLHHTQKPDLIDTIFKIGLFGWLMFLIWGSFVFWAVVAIYLYFW